MFKIDMRKTNTKLQLKTKTVRVLQLGELVQVNGGGSLTNNPALCRIGEFQSPDGGGAL
jgi:hypothetical protein